MRMQTLSIDDTSAALQFEEGGTGIVTVHCNDATEIAHTLTRAVNMHAALVSALTPFRSDQLGNDLLGLINVDDEDGEVMLNRLGHLINMIDVILDAADPDGDDA